MLDLIRRGAGLVHLVALALPLGTVACVGPTQAGRVEGPIQAVDVPDTRFAADLHQVLRDGRPSPERLGLVVGVVRRQLAHAAHRFGTGHDARATDGVLGALYLVRTGEGRAEMVDAEGERALAGAIERVSAHGDEGRAEALMRMRLAALPANAPARHNIEDHLAALTSWKAETRTGGPMRQLGSIERAALSRALVEPTDEALASAVHAISDWVGRAVEYQIAFRQTGARPEREEAIEASRALESGGATLATLYLRNGDARGAWDALEQTGVGRVILPGLATRIHNAATNDTARDWRALAAVFASQRDEDSEGDADMDPQLLAAGLWGTSLEAYRRDPKSIDSAMLLSRALIRFGMPEGAPLVLADALGPSTAPPVMSAVLGLVANAVGESASIDDLDAARRTFISAGPILEQAAGPSFKGRIQPTAARVRFAMAGIEVRAGNLAGARPLLQAAVAEEPSASGFTTLALVERQAGDQAAALAQVDRALAAPDTRGTLLDAADAHLLAFELQRDAGQADRAKASLDAALRATLGARQTRTSTADHARSERILGRILEGYGDGKGATRAFERALAAAGADRSTLGAAMLDAVGRALVRRDLVAARAALKRGIEGDVSDDDLVYAGLCVALLERETKAPSDGTVERALKPGARGSWTSKLSAWGSGKLSDADLSTAAQSASQRVEAAFYTAMARRVAGDPTADQRLRQVAGSPVIDLLEVQLARDLTSPRVRADLPGGVQLP